jgi:hypothetical protein
MQSHTTVARVPVTVNTSSGLVEGHLASKTDGVSEYLGIPFVCPCLHKAEEFN